MTITTFRKRGNSVMTLRQNFDNMMEQGHGYIRLNNLCGLERFTMDEFGRPCDELLLWFISLGAKNCGQIYSIQARDFDKVILAVAECTKDYFLRSATMLNMELLERSK